MWRLLHLLGWLIAAGLGGWLVGILVLIGFETALGGAPNAGYVFGVGGGVAGGVTGLLLARVSWRRQGWHKPLAAGGAVLGFLGLLVGTILIVAAEARHVRAEGRILAGFELFLLGLLAIVVAAIGIGLVIAGVGGIVQRRLVERGREG